MFRVGGGLCLRETQLTMGMAKSNSLMMVRVSGDERLSVIQTQYGLAKRY